MKFNDKLQVSQQVMDRIYKEDLKKHSIYSKKGIFDGKYKEMITEKHELYSDHASGDDLNTKLHVFDGTRRGNK